MSRFTVYALAVILSISSGPASAQTSNASSQEDLQLANARALLQSERVEIIKEEILFSETEAEEFWPMYDDYLADLNVIRDRHVTLIQRYIEAYYDGDVTEKFASQMIDDYLGIKSDTLKVQKKHLRKFRRVLPARKVARFYQLENKINVETEAQLALFIPLVDPV